MSTTLTPTRQQTEVGEGLAVGCLVVGVSAVAANDDLDAAFGAALASWPWAARYPSLVRAKRPALEPVLRRSAHRRHSHVARWVLSVGLYVPQLRDDEWDLTAACARIEEATAIPFRRWASLASNVVDGLDRVWRSPPPAASDPSPGGLDLG